MLSLTDLKVGKKILYKDEPHEVVSSELSKLGRGGSFMRTKLKNLKTGAIFEYTFKGNEAIYAADISSGQAQFLYSDSNDAFFMNEASYEQFSISREKIESELKFLKEGENVQILFFDGEALTVSLPIKLTLEVTYTEPGLKGDTVASSNKAAKLETGAQIQVPLFIKTGDLIVVDTRNGSYVERAKK